MKALLLLAAMFLIGCTHDKKPSVDPVPPPPPTVTPDPEMTQEKNVVVYFHFNSARLSHAQKEILKRELSARKAGSRVLIVAHADSQGPNKYNQRLSEKRAKAVSKYLDKLNIENSWVAKGESELLNADKTIADHKKNRRAAIDYTIVVK